MKTMDELFDSGEIDLLISKTKKKAEKKLIGKTFAGMETEDVVQEILIKVYRSFETYDKDKAALSTYIDHIMENMIRDAFKKCASNKNLANTNAIEIEGSYSSDSDEDRYSSAVQVGKRDLGYLEAEIMVDIQTNKYLKKYLSEREREIFVLHYRGYSKTEIADMLGVTKARITQLWEDIRAKLK